MNAFRLLALLSLMVPAAARAGQPPLQWQVSFSQSAGGDEEFGAAAVDGTGMTHLLYRDNNRGLHIARFNPAGAYVSTLDLSRTTGGVAWELGLALDSSGDYLVSGRGSLETPTANDDLFAVKYDTNGVAQWVRSFDSGQDDNGFAALTDQTNELVAIGASGGNQGGGPPNGPMGVLVVKYDSGGALQWSRTWQDSSNWNTQPYGATTDAVGNVYVVSWSQTYFGSIRKINSGLGTIAWTVTGVANPLFGVTVQSGTVFATTAQGGAGVGLHRINPITGTYLGLTTVPYTGTDFLQSASRIGFDASGSIYVAGGTYLPGVGRNVPMIVKIDRAMTTILWAQYYDKGYNENGGGGQAFAFSLDPSGIPHLNGGTAPQGNTCVESNDLFVRVLNPATGVATSALQVDGPQIASARGIASDPQGNTYLVTADPPLVKKFNSAGVLQPVVFDPFSSTVYCVNEFSSVAYKNNAVYVAARAKITATYCCPSDQEDLLVIKYDKSSGAQAGMYTYAPENKAKAGRMVLDGSDNLYVVWWSETVGGKPLMVTAWTVGGGLLWSRSIASSQLDGIGGIAVDDSYNLYVAGDAMDGYGNIASVVQRLDAATGATLWSRTAGFGVGLSVPTDLACIGTNVYLCGGYLDNYPVPARTFGFLKGFNSSGSLIYTRTNDGGQHQVYWGLSASPSGTLYVTGAIAPQIYVGDGINGGGYQDVILEAWDVNDTCWAPGWSARWDSGFGGDDMVNGIAPGSIYLATNTTGRSFSVIKYGEGSFSGAALASSLTASPNPAQIGNVVTVTLTVSDTGTRDVTDVAPTFAVTSGAGGLSAVLGPSPASYSRIPGGQFRVFTWSATVTAATAATFSATPSGADACGGGTIAGPTAAPFVAGYKSTLVADLAVTPATAAVGDTVRVDLTVTNNGIAAATVNGLTATLFTTGVAAGDVERVTGAAIGSLTLAAGSTTRFSWTFLVKASSVAVGFSATASGTDAVFGPLQVSKTGALTTTNPSRRLSGVLTVVPGAVYAGGSPARVYFTVSNSGANAANNVAPILLVSAPSLVVVSGPSSSNVVIPPTGQAVFTWTLTGVTTGAVSLTGSATGVDAGDASVVFAQAGGSLSIGVPTVASLALSPASPHAGDPFQIRMTVTNATGVVSGSLAPHLVLAPAAAVSVSAAPAAATGVAPTASVVFTWTGTASAAGPVSFTASVTGLFAGLQGGSSVTLAAVIQNAEVVPPFEGEAIVWPNPVSGDATSLAVRLKAPASRIEVNVYNNGYQRVWSGEWGAQPQGDAKLDLTGLSGWAPGLYIVRFRVTLADGGEQKLPAVRIAVKR